MGISLVSCSGIRPRYHEVAQGDHLSAIAKHYDVPMASLEKYNREAIREGLRPGDRLYIPFEESPRWNREFDGEGRLSGDGVPEGTLLAEFVWPVSGTLSSVFGPRARKHAEEAFHEGIDIAARLGTPVKAARSGHVIYAGNRVRGYGNMVIIRHADSYSTVYAHLSKFAVKKGQFVGRGQLVGKVGRTGRAHGSHLHFEIRDRQTPVDPISLLPGQYAHTSVRRGESLR